ncbi:MAG: hypothetical protein ABJ092_14225 [Gillisia sp.]
MEPATQPTFTKKEFHENYLAHINWDWLVFKSLTIFGSIIFVGLLAFVLWFLPDFR